MTSQAAPGNFTNQNGSGTFHFSRASAKWSVFVYIDGDNNLEQFAIEDLNEMERVGSTGDVNIIVQIDRVNGFDKSNGDWTDTRRYYVTKDDDFEVINSERLDVDGKELGELNMADSGTLTDFLNWGFDNYPAEHYLVVMWDHGRGIFRSSGSQSGLFKGFNEDLSSNTQEMKLWELDSVLEDVSAKKGGERIDILGFDQCWLGNIETAYELMDSVDYLVASADEEPDKGWNYAVPLQKLVNNSDMSPREFAITITDDYIDEYKNKTSYDYMTQATIDLKYLNHTFIDTFNNFTNLLIENFYDISEILFDLRQEIDNYYYPCPDLFQFVKLVETNSSLPEALRSSAAGLMTAYSDLVLAEGHGLTHPDAYGLAIYFPDSIVYDMYSNWQYEYTSKIDFSAERWTEFLQMFFDPLRIEHVPLKDTEDVVNPYTVQADIQGYKLDLEKIGVYYTLNDTDPDWYFVNMTLPDIGEGFVAELPVQPKYTHVYYYIEAVDVMGNSIHHPKNAPKRPINELNHFYVGTDITPPEIFHAAMGDRVYTESDYEIIVKVTDNIGVNKSKILLYYKATDDKNYIGLQMTEYPAGSDQYRTYIPSQSIGSIIYYHFRATDTVTKPNTARLPEDGDFMFRILGIIINIAWDSYHFGNTSDYNTFFNLLKAPGYNITGLSDPINKNNLAEINMVVITEPKIPYSTSELFALKDFLRSGGSLFVIGGSNKTVMNSLTESFDIFWNDNTEGVGYSGTFGSNEAIFNNVDELYYYPPGLSIESGERSSVLVKNDLESAVLAVYSYFIQGKIVAVTKGFFSDTTINASYNIKFLNNLALWMVKCPIAVPVGEGTQINGVIVKNPDRSNRFDILEDDFVGFDGNDSVFPEWRSSQLNFTWDFGDGASAYGVAPAHRYTEEGQYNVTLMVITYDGYTDTGNIIISVENLAPQAYPGYTEINGLKVFFNASASEDTPSDTSSLTFFWDFGDGETATGIAPEHTYMKKGVYYITLTVRDDDGATSKVQLRLDLGETDRSSLSAYIPGIAAALILIFIVTVLLVLQRKKQLSQTGEVDKSRVERAPPMRRRP